MNRYGRQDDRGRQGNTYHNQGYYQRDDRSRSRENRNFREDYGRGRDYAHGRNFHGERGGRDDRFQRQGGKRNGRGPRPNEMMVSMNYFPVRLTQSSLEEWVIYSVDIIDVRRKKKVNPETNEFFDPFQWQFIPAKQNKESDMSRFPEQLARRILNNLNKQENLCVVSDGRAICYSNKRLFNKENCTSANPESTDEKGLAVPGRYGPADDGGHNTPQGTSDVYNDYHVRAKRSVEENDPDADRVKNAWYRVRLKEVGLIPISEVMKIFVGKQTKYQAECKYLNEIKQATEVIVKSGQFSVMKSYGRSPRKFFFPEDIQESIMRTLRHGKGRKIAEDFMNSSATVSPNIGMESRIKICSNGNAYFNTDSCLDYFYREFQNEQKSTRSVPKPVPVLNENKWTLSGVKVDFHKIIPIDKRQEIASAIRKLTFHVEYVRRKNSADWLARKKELGWSEEKIRRANKMVRKNCRMKRYKSEDNQLEEGIKWCANDPNIHSFVVKPPRKKEDTKNEERRDEEGVTHTIASYFDTRYGIRLRYPNMPCIFIGKGEWYPVEFLFQGPGRAVHGDLQQRKLDFYDMIAGSKRIEHIMNSSQKLSNLLESNSQADLLRTFGIERSNEPVTFKAKVLPEPKLHFQNSQARISDGKWDLRDVQFDSPADLSSFACINLTGDSQFSTEYMFKLFQIMKRHDISMPQNVDYFNQKLLNAVSVSPRRGPNPETIHDAFQDAVMAVKRIFLFDREGIFQRKGVWFKTRYYNETTETWEVCFIIPLLPDIEGKVGIIKKKGPTHENNGEELRIQVLCNFLGQKKQLDPFEFRLALGGKYEGLIEGKWVVVDFLRHIYIAFDGKIRDVEEPKVLSPLILDSESITSKIDLLPMVFVLLPNDKKDTYNIVKGISQFEFGLSTQCCVKGNYQKQKNKNQYLSNIALKLNTKLMNSSNNARAWRISVPGYSNDGIPWVNEVVTMVIGITLSHSLGNNNQSNSVVGATVCLDHHLMQMSQICGLQSKSSLVSADTMSTLTKLILNQFKAHCGQYPKRVLVYRNGSSDGDFDHIREEEINVMRLALRDELKRLKEDFYCPINCKSGCLHCTPPITYIVCQTQHSICVTPQLDNFNSKQNVWSGTCVDDPKIMDYRDGQLLATKDVDRTLPSNSKMTLFEDVREFGYDFILTSHGGLKGTSKPVYYRVVLNENAVWKPNAVCTSLTKEMLEICTYHQSYQYGTATKAVRAVPVVAYSMRIANLFMGFKDYLIARGGLQKVFENNSETESSTKYYYVRTENKENSEMPPHVLRNIMHLSYSPYNDQIKSCPPLRPHMSA